MKKISCILLFVLLLFNWCGYRWAIILMEQKADMQLEADLNKNDYDESQLIEIKVPVNIPYQTEQSKFERCDGELEVNGTHYKFVQRKVQYGFLILKCIPNRTRQRLELVKTDLFKLTNDLQYDKNAKKSGDSHSTLKKNQVSEYINLKQLPSAGFCASMFVQPYNLYRPGLFINFLHSTPGHPPKPYAVC